MNKSMVVTAISMVVTFVGGFLIAKGLVTADVVDRLSDVNTIGQVVGAVGTVWAIIVGLRGNTPTALVDKAAKLDGVAEVKVTDRALVDNTKGNNISIVSSH